MKEGSEDKTFVNKEDLQTKPVPEMKHTNKKVIIFDIVFIIAIFVGIFIYMMNTDGAENIGELIRTADYRWVLAGIVCLIVMWLAEAVSLHIPVKRLYPTQKFTNSIKITMIGQLFNNVTPFFTGGQIMQTYEMNQSGKRTSDSLSILTMKFLTQQVSMIVFTILILLTQFNYFRELFKNYMAIGIIGISMNIVLLIMLVALGTNKNFVMKIAKPIIKGIAKIKIGKIRFIKNPEAKIEKFEKSVMNYSEQFKLMREHKGMVLNMFLAGIVQTAAYYAITYTVYKTFGNSGTNYLQIVTLQTFLMLLITFIPTPGSGLGAEGGFLLIFGPIFREGTINLSILVWRIYTFYLPILIGALFMAPVRRAITKRREEAKKA